MRTREEARTALDSNFKGLMDCLGQLTEAELTSCPVAGIWTVKDVVAHVWSWSDEAVRTTRAWHGARRWQEGVTYDDAWNESQVSSKGILPLLTVVDGVTGAHRRLMHLIDTADDEILAEIGKAPWGEEMPLVDFVYCMALHYSDHIADLSNYRERCLQSDTA